MLPLYTGNNRLRLKETVKKRAVTVTFHPNWEILVFSLTLYLKPGMEFARLLASAGSAGSSFSRCWNNGQVTAGQKPHPVPSTPPPLNCSLILFPSPFSPAVATGHRPLPRGTDASLILALSLSKKKFHSNKFSLLMLCLTVCYLTLFSLALLALYTLCSTLLNFSKFGWYFHKFSFNKFDPAKFHTVYR